MIKFFCGRFNLTNAIKLLLKRPTLVLCPPSKLRRDQPEWLLLSLCVGVLERSSAVFGAGAAIIKIPALSSSVPVLQRQPRDRFDVDQQSCENTVFL